jgi:hypothetical protein
LWPVGPYRPVTPEVAGSSLVAPAPHPCKERRETLRDKLRRKLEEHTDEVVAAYLAGIRSDDPNRAYRAADAWISRMHSRPKESVDNVAVPRDALDVAAMAIEEPSGSSARS